MIKVQNLAKAYKMDEQLFWALDGVSLEIQEGEFVAILGPSGSGKSTLMHLIGGLDRPTKGRVVVDNSDLGRLTNGQLATFRNKKVGFVFQFFNLIPRLNAFDNVKLPLIYAKEPTNIQDKVLKVLTAVSLQDKLKNTPNQLSGGEQQRVAIARALINDPKVILADEPTGNLDTKSGEQILSALLNLNRSGKTIVLVTHEKPIAAAADRIITIKDGKVVP